MADLSRTICRPARNGVTVLETILALPLLVIALMACVEFGLLLSNLQYLELASRAGAAAAAEISVPTAGPVPPEVINAVNRSLSDSGIVPGRVTLIHNVGAAPPYRLTSGGLACPPPTLVAAPASRQYVRVTVCAETTQLTPNLLQVFGLDIGDWFAQQTSTRRYQF